MKKRTGQKLAALGLVLALGAAACGSDGDDSAATTTAPTTTTTEAPMTNTTSPTPDESVLVGVDAVESPASGLRSLLTAQLQEHVYLAGTAVFTAINVPSAFEAAAATLDQNSQDLAASVASLYGEDAGDAFLQLWRTHIGFFVDYTNARAMGDEAGQMAAMTALQGYREDFGAFLESANPVLTKEAVVAELQPHVETVFAAIDAVVDGDADAFDKLKTAANVMPNTAATLAGAFAAQFELTG